MTTTTKLKDRNHFRSARKRSNRFSTVRSTYSSHRLIEARSLAMHAVMAAKIDLNPKLLDIPRRNLKRWRARAGEVPAWLEDWSRILRRPWREIAAIMTEPSEQGARLRQSSPFAGVLSPAERRRIYRAFQLDPGTRR